MHECEVMAEWWLESSEKILLRGNIPITNFTWIHPGVNPRIHSEKQPYNILLVLVSFNLCLQ
jgi:hypothetical protein